MNDLFKLSTILLIRLHRKIFSDNGQTFLIKVTWKCYEALCWKKETLWWIWICFFKVIVLLFRFFWFCFKIRRNDVENFLIKISVEIRDLSEVWKRCEKSIYFISHGWVQYSIPSQIWNAFECVDSMNPPIFLNCLEFHIELSSKFTNNEMN